MKAVLNSNNPPLVRLVAETGDEKWALNQMWEEGVRLVSYNGAEKLAITPGKEIKSKTA